MKFFLSLGFMIILGLLALWFHSMRHTRYPIDLTIREIFPDEQARELARAAARGQIQRIKSILEAGADINYQGRYGISPLWWAVRSNNLQGVRALLEHGANPNVMIEEERESIIESAAVMDDSRILEAVLEFHGNPELSSLGSSRTPIFSAVIADQKANLITLIKAGANLNHQDGTGTIAALSAAMVGDYEMTWLLLEAGADPDLANNFGRTVRNDVMNL